MKQSIYCLTMALSCAAASSVMAATTWKTKVANSTYRITLDDDGILNVVRKSFLTGRSVAQQVEMKIAVRQATGCEIVEELWFDAKLKGKLQCPDGAKPNPPR